MIPREKRWAIIGSLVVLLITETTSQDDKSYEESDWIPVTPSVPKGSREQKASDRVLSLDVPAQRFVGNEDFDQLKSRPPPLQEQQFLRETPYKKAPENVRPRKIKYQPEYRYETPPPPPVKGQPQINYYNTAPVKPYYAEQQPPIKEQPNINYYKKPNSNPYLINQPTFSQAGAEPQNYYSGNQQQNTRYVPVPSVNPQAPAVDAPNLYDQYNLPFNSSFYQSLNPTSINEELYEAINGSGPSIPVSRAKEPVELVYVPVDNQNPTHPLPQDPRISYKPIVNQNVQDGKQEKLYFNSNVPLAVPSQNTQDIYRNLNTPVQQNRPPFTQPTKGERLEQIQQDFAQQALQAQKLQQQLDQRQVPLEIVTTTTPKPKKRKPHQPPLAVFMESPESQGDISEVLEVLKRAKSIAVQDSITKDSPKIFIGPSSLNNHDGYIKFPLPYLNSIDGNRIERKIEQLPLFVAPLSYKTPPGFSKIPLPSPHVGSVVVSNAEKPSTHKPILLDQNSRNNYQHLFNTNQPKTTPRVTNYLGNGYNNLDQNVGKYSIPYQSTTPNSFNEQSTSSNIKYSIPYQSTPNSKNIFNEQPTPANVHTYQSNLRQPDVYNLPTNTYEPSGKSSPGPTTFDLNPEIYNIQNNYEEQTVKPYKLPDILSRVITQSPDSIKELEEEKGDSQPEQEHKRPVLPEVNPLELAITEFELDQINNQYAEPNKKIVKHANAKPQTRFEYDNVRSSTSAPTSRGRVHYESQQTTERVQPTRRRGRTRQPLRTTTTTTTTTTTPVPENERYTVLEEFVATQPVRGVSAENYQESRDDSSRKSSTPIPEYDATYTQYLPENVNPLRAEIPRRSSTTESQYIIEQDDLYKRPYSEPELPRRNPSASGYVASEQTQSDNQYLPEKDTDLYSELQSPRRNPTEPADTTYIEYNGGREKTNTPDFQSNRTNNFNNYQTRFEDYTDNRRPESEFSEDTRSRNTADQNTFDSNIRQNNQHNEPYNVDLNKQQFTQEISTLTSREKNFQPELQNLYQTQSEDKSNIASGQYLDNTFRLQPSQEQQQEEEPSSYNSGRINSQDYDHFVNPFEDQAVRSLLSSNLLVPSTQQKTQTTPLREERPVTEPAVEVEVTTESQPSTTTSPPRTRGRQRARQPSTAASTATSAPRRNASRRRPSSRPATERIDSGLDYSRETADISRLPNSNSKQRFRTRGRPLQNTIAESTSTTENELSSVNQPTLEGGFEASFNKEPQSYMQFEHIIDDQQIITAQPKEEDGVKEYHQIYSFQSPSSTDRQQVGLEYENTNIRTTPVVDVEIRHPVVEDNQRSSDIITKADGDEQYVRYNANIRSGGVLNNNKKENSRHEETTRQSTRTRGRTRGRSRFATSTTTSRPVTRIITSTHRTTTEVQEENEFYGFLKTPNFRPHVVNDKPAEVTARTEESSVQFLGEIRPKYNTRKVTTSAPENQSSQEVSRTRTRGRTRAPSTRTNNNIYNQRQSDNEVNSSRNTEQITRRSNDVRTRGRGSTHFRNPESMKRDSDEDVENGNYPENFLQRLETPKPSNSLYTTSDSSDEDQSPYSSIHKPKILPTPEGWSQSAYDPNQIQLNDKIHFTHQKMVDAEQNSNTEHTETSPVTTKVEVNDGTFKKDAEIEDLIKPDLDKIETTDKNSAPQELTEITTPRKPGRRRGVWKVIRHKVVDPLEAAESQNYESVLNAFESIQKIEPHTKERFDENTEKSVSELVTDSKSTKTDDDTANLDQSEFTTEIPKPSTESIFNTIYEMFGIFNKQSKNESVVTFKSTEEPVIFPTTTSVDPTFPDEITENSAGETTDFVTTTDLNIPSETSTDSVGLHQDIPSTQHNDPPQRQFEVEPWEMKAVKTSTSTEVSHETEICYKGRCVKSKGRKKV